MAAVLGVIVGCTVAALLWRLFFEDMDEFKECLRFWITPDVISMFRGEWAEDWWAEVKLGAWMFLSGLAGFGVFHALQ